MLDNTERSNDDVNQQLSLSIGSGSCGTEERNIVVDKELEVDSLRSPLESLESSFHAVDHEHQMELKKARIQVAYMATNKGTLSGITSQDPSPFST